MSRALQVVSQGQDVFGLRRLDAAFVLILLLSACHKPLADRCFECSGPGDPSCGPGVACVAAPDGRGFKWWCECGGETADVVADAGDGVAVDAGTDAGTEVTDADSGEPAGDVDEAAPEVLPGDSDEVPMDDAPADSLVEGGLGWPCVGNGDCQSGYCVDASGGRVCTIVCADTCPGGWTCTVVTAGTDTISVCLPDCVPSCGGKECGLDGCGAFCGYCAKYGAKCVDGKCTCVPEDHRACCGKAVCWFDSCMQQGAKVEDCPGGCSGGACQPCPPDCSGRECGPDGCGGACGGPCPGGAYCDDGACTCLPATTKSCCGVDACTYDSCGTVDGLTACTTGTCKNGACCAPACSGKTCGPDGCGGTCGSCGAGYVCVSGTCEVLVTCGNGTCDTGEGCGKCPSDCTCACGQACTGDACVTTRCAGLDCGSDGCGGTCGSLQGGCAFPAYTCVAGRCTCNPSCAGKACGTDGCGGSCGTCGAGKMCGQGVCIDDGTCTKTLPAGTCASDMTPDGDKCSTARVIGRTDAIQGFQASGNTTSHKNDDDLPSSLLGTDPDCWDANNDDMYKVWLVEGDVLKVTATPLWNEFDLSLKLYRGTACKANWEADLVTCQHGKSSGKAEAYTYAATSDGWISIVVDGESAMDDDWGPYELVVSIQEAVSGACCP